VDLLSGVGRHPAVITTAVIIPDKGALPGQARDVLPIFAQPLRKLREERTLLLVQRPPIRRLARLGAVGNPLAPGTLQQGTTILALGVATRGVTADFHLLSRLLLRQFP
jgi:hypothetical protein